MHHTERGGGVKRIKRALNGFSDFIIKKKKRISLFNL